MISMNPIHDVLKNYKALHLGHTSKCMVLRHVQNTAPYNLSTPKDLVNLIHGCHWLGFGKLHNFGVLLSMYVRDDSGALHVKITL